MHCLTSHITERRKAVCSLNLIFPLSIRRMCFPPVWSWTCKMDSRVMWVRTNKRGYSLLPACVTPISVSRDYVLTWRKTSVYNWSECITLPITTISIHWKWNGFIWGVFVFASKRHSFRMGHWCYKTNYVLLPTPHTKVILLAFTIHSSFSVPYHLNLEKKKKTGKATVQLLAHLHYFFKASNIVEWC